MITFVCGELCSGKTVYAKALAELTDGVYIEVGDIVREFKKSQDRKVLQDSKDLAAAIIMQLSLLIAKNSPKQCIVSGVRQKRILKAFPDSTIIWIQCPIRERKRRYSSRARTGDELSFEEAEKGDQKLGILKTKDYIFNL